MNKKNNFNKILSMSEQDMAVFLFYVGFRPFPSIRAASNWVKGSVWPRGPVLDSEEELKIRLCTWIFDNREHFVSASVPGKFYGKEDDKYVYICPDAFKGFCVENGYEPLDLLRQLSSSGAILTRKGTWHGGYYKTARIEGKLYSCVWLIKDEFFFLLQNHFNKIWR